MTERHRRRLLRHVANYVRHRWAFVAMWEDEDVARERANLLAAEAAAPNDVVGQYRYLIYKCHYADKGRSGWSPNMAPDILRKLNRE